MTNNSDQQDKLEDQTYSEEEQYNDVGLEDNNKNNSNANENNDSSGGNDANDHEQGFTTEIGGHRVHLNDKQLPLVGVFLTALVLLVALLLRKRTDTDNYTYGVIVSVLAMLLSFAGTVYHVWTRESNAVSDGVTYFLFVWCFVGACVLTFLGPFEVTGNGYFSAWAMTISAAMAVGITRNDLQSYLTGFVGSLIGLGACAIVVLLDVVDEFGGRYQGEGVYALIVSIVTIFVVVFYLYQQHTTTTAMMTADSSTVTFSVCAAFAVMWIILACLVTFRGPFNLTGNGYFGAWGGAIVSVYAAKGARHHSSS